MSTEVGAGWEAYTLTLVRDIQTSSYDWNVILKDYFGSFWIHKNVELCTESSASAATLSRRIGASFLTCKRATIATYSKGASHDDNLTHPCAHQLRWCQFEQQSNVRKWPSSNDADLPSARCYT